MLWPAASLLPSLFVPSPAPRPRRFSPRLVSSSDSPGEKSPKHTFFRCNPLKCIFLGVPFLGHSSLCYMQGPNKTCYALSDLSNKIFRASNWDFSMGNSRGSCRWRGPLDPHQIPTRSLLLLLGLSHLPRSHYTTLFFPAKLTVLLPLRCVLSSAAPLSLWCLQTRSGLSAGLFLFFFLVIAKRLKWPRTEGKLSGRGAATHRYHA